VVVDVRAIDLFAYMNDSGKKGENNRAPMNANDELIILGARLKTYRETKGYTSYEKFANAHKLSRSQIGRYEKGGDIRFSTLITVLNALDLTLTEFFTTDLSV
jgi:hypothetical protein